MRNAIASATNTSSDSVHIDSVSSTSSNNATSSNATSSNTSNSTVTLQYHVIVNSNVDNATTVQDAVNSTQTTIQLSNTLSTVLDHSVTVVSITPTTVTTTRDTSPLVVIANISSTNTLSAEIVGPGQTITLLIVQTSKPVVSVSVDYFSISGLASRSWTITKTSSNRVLSLSYFVSAADPSGQVFYSVNWIDASGNSDSCIWSDRACVDRALTVDTQSPTLSLISALLADVQLDEWAADLENSGWTFVFQNPNGGSVDRSLVFTMATFEEIFSLQSNLFSASCDAKSGSANCAVAIAAIAVNNNDPFEVAVWVDITRYSAGNVLMDAIATAFMDAAQNPSGEAQFTYELPEVKTLD